MVVAAGMWECSGDTAHGAGDTFSGASGGIKPRHPMTSHIDHDPIIVSKALTRYPCHSLGGAMVGL